MNSSPLTPVVTTLRLGLHVLVTVLAVVVAVRALLPGGGGHGVWVLVLTVVWLAVYFAGTELPRRSGDRVAAGAPASVVESDAARVTSPRGPVPVWNSWVVSVWLATLTVLWLALLGLTPDAVYLAFGLFFVYLHLLPRPWKQVAV
ncbi:sensor histidine kinase, partial [Nocardia sp. NPDC058497]